MRLRPSLRVHRFNLLAEIFARGRALQLQSRSELLGLHREVPRQNHELPDPRSIARTSGRLIVSSIAFWMYFCQVSSFIASLIFVIAGFTSNASPSSSSVPGFSPLAPFALSVTTQVLNFLLSPTIMTLEI